VCACVCLEGGKGRLLCLTRVLSLLSPLSPSYTHERAHQIAHAYISLSHIHAHTCTHDLASMHAHSLSHTQSCKYQVRAKSVHTSLSKSALFLQGSFGSVAKEFRNVQIIESAKWRPKMCTRAHGKQPLFSGLFWLCCKRTIKNFKELKVPRGGQRCAHGPIKKHHFMEGLFCKSSTEQR